MAYGLNKQAEGGIAAIAGLGPKAVGFMGDLSATAATYVLAAAAATGIGIGYIGAKTTAHGKQEMDTVKKEYQNERMKADLGYLSSQLKNEYQKSKDKQPPKSARIIA